MGNSVKKRLMAGLCILALAVGVFFGNSVQPVYTKSKLSALHVEGTKLCDKKGKVVQLRGVSTHGLSWYPEYVNDKYFKELHDKWGANVVRLAMYTEEYNGYCSGDANNRKNLKALVKKGVKLASKYNMYVIVDWHILSDGNPKTHQKASKAFFKDMSKALKGYDNVLYEICNEPNGGTDWKTIKSYAKAVRMTRMRSLSWEHLPGHRMWIRRRPVQSADIKTSCMHSISMREHTKMICAIK